jgi:hypothetical protein
MEPSGPAPLHGVVGASRVPSMVGSLAPTGCTSAHAFVIEPSGGEEEEEEEDHYIMAVTGPVVAPVIRQTTQISIGPRGRPQGPLVQRIATTPPTSLTPSLAAPPSPPALPSSEAGPSDPGMSSDLKSLCGNRLLRRFAHFPASSDKGQALGSWDLMAGPSR